MNLTCYACLCGSVEADKTLGTSLASANFCLLCIYGPCLRFPVIKCYISSLGSLSCFGTEQLSPLLSLSFAPLFLFLCCILWFPMACSLLSVCTLQHVLCCTFSPSWFLEIKALDFAVWWAICVAFARASCDILWITMHAYGHSKAACKADFQFIFTMFLPFNCPERNAIRARWNEALWRRQLGYGALTSSHTQHRLLCSCVYLVSFESIFLLLWIRVKKCAATSALPALCSLSLCHFFVKYTNVEGTSHVCFADLAWIPNESRYKRELPVM